MVGFGVVTFDEAKQAIDLDTMLFLLGMMIVLGYLELSGFFAILERRLLGFAEAAHRLWLGLAAFSTLAGNLTVIGSVANVIVFETARREGIEVGFFECLRVGLPLTLLTLAFAWFWI